MAIDDSELTVSQAEMLARSGLAEHWPEESLGFVQGKTIVSGCGWVFTVDTAGRGAASARNGRLFPTLVLVVRTSAQVVATSRPYAPDQFARVCERLLARSLANGSTWCRTMDAHLHDQGDSVGQDARDAGLEQLQAGVIPTGPL